MTAMAEDMSVIAGKPVVSCATMFERLKFGPSGQS